MTLADLHDQLAPSFPEYARKNLKTAVRVLARASGYSDPQHCSVDEFKSSLPSLYTHVERYLIAQGKKPHTVRNIKNYLSRLFRYAEAQHIFSLAPAQLLPRYDARNRPSRPGASASWRNGSYLLYAQWPANLQDAFRTFVTWATKPLVPGRDASLRKRPKTIEDYRQTFEGYFGFLHHHCHRSPLNFEDLFALSLVTSYVHWYVNDHFQHPNWFIRRFLKNVLALTRQYRPMPELRAQLAALQKTIPIPPPTYNKEDAWVSLSTLNEIGCSLWPRKQPSDLPGNGVHPGRRFAVRASLSLMFRLWCYIPLRQRNMREMQLGTNLHKDAHGKWWITFRGEQLKVAVKRGRQNTFAVPFPEKLVPVLEDYLSIWRPILLRKATQSYPHVFLTQYGTPYQETVLRGTTLAFVYRYTGKHWHPHIIRSVWATEWIRKTNADFYTAAIMLNDRLETVIAKYTHLLEEDVADKAYRLINERISSGI